MSKTKLPKKLTVKCIVAAVNANGEPDFYFVKVKCTQEQYDDGQHYDKAKSQAEEEGYEPYLAYDEKDTGARAIISTRFVWKSASTVEV